MAQIIPSDYAQFQRSGWHVPEIETLNTLWARLPADYTVFHGVHWTREGFGRTRCLRGYERGQPREWCGSTIEGPGTEL